MTTSHDPERDLRALLHEEPFVRALARELCRGPVGVMMVRSPESWNMGTALLKWFVYTLVVGVFCAYLTGMGHAPGTEYMAIFRFTGAIAFLGYVFSHVHEWTWKGLDTSIMVKFMIDGVIYSLITAGTFAWLWPAA